MAGGCRGLAKGKMPCSQEIQVLFYLWHLQPHPGSLPGGLRELRLLGQKVPGQVLRGKERRLAPGYSPPNQEASEAGSWD